MVKDRRITDEGVGAKGEGRVGEGEERNEGWGVRDGDERVWMRDGRAMKVDGYGNNE